MVAMIERAVGVEGDDCVELRVDLYLLRRRARSALIWSMLRSSPEVLASLANRWPADAAVRTPFGGARGRSSSFHSSVTQFFAHRIDVVHLDGEYKARSRLGAGHGRRFDQSAAEA